MRTYEQCYINMTLCIVLVLVTVPKGTNHPKSSYSLMKAQKQGASSNQYKSCLPNL